LVEGAVSVRRLPLGVLLVREGVASEDDIQDALDECIRTRERLAEVVLRRGWISKKRLAKLLADRNPGGASIETAASAASPVDLIGAWVQKTHSPVELVGAWLEPTNHGSQIAEEEHDPDGRDTAAEADYANVEEEPMGTMDELDGQMLQDIQLPTFPTFSGSVVEHLRALMTEVEMLEHELLDMRQLVEAQETELAELHQARASDLNTISSLGAELEERRARLGALRAAVGDLAVELDS
jgi:hypothetical protein